MGKKGINSEKYFRYKRSMKGRFTNARSNSKKKNIRWSISFEQFKNIVKDRKCFYCKKDIGITVGSALDRINPKLGYFLRNVVPCCKLCNSIKSNIFTQKETELIITLILKLREIEAR